MIGKKIRLARIINEETKKTCIVPLDHGTTFGPITGLKNYLDTVNCVLKGGADALIMHKGLLRKVLEEEKMLQGNFVMHLSASTAINPEPDNKVLVASVEEAIKYGAVAVSIQVNIGTKNESRMLEDFAKVSRSCMDWGMPLIAMMYGTNQVRDWKELQHIARLAEELGADVVKINYPGSIENLRNLLNGVHIPVIIAGGENFNNVEHLLSMVDCCMQAGANGVAIGRNIFQNPEPQFITDLVSSIVHKKITLHESLIRVRAAQHTVIY